MNITPEKRTRIFWSIASGICLTCAFDNIGLGFLAWFALGILLFGLRNAPVREALYLGLLAGFVHYVTLLYWLVPTMHRYGPLPVWLSIGVLMLLAFYLALYFALFSGMVVAVVKQPVFLVLAVPVFWVSLEYVKTFLFSGFPWGLIGYSQYNYLHLIQAADIFGVYGVSFFVAAVNAALLVIFLQAGGFHWQNTPAGLRNAVFCFFFIIVIFALNAGYGRYKIEEMDRAAAGADRLNVSVVQGNIEQSLKWEEAHVVSIVDGYLRLSEKALSSGAQVIVWPETAMPFYFLQEREQTGRVLDAVGRMEAWFLIGSPSFEYDREKDALWFYNSAYLVDPKGMVSGVYDKVHLVPFGEYVPLGDWLPFVNRMVQSIGDFRPGTAGKVLSMTDADLAVQICYEIIFPHLSAEMVKNGGSLIVNITNDAWFGKTAGPRQHFSMAVFRSVENRRALIRSANTGISAFVDPSGRVTERSELFETAVISRSVPVITGKQSFYTKYMDLLPVFCLAAALLILAAAGIRRNRKMHGGKTNER
ncbi:MAG: apolipoprotein N-acyltransferase [Desulfosalsimonadaceae bacterium]